MELTTSPVRMLAIFLLLFVPLGVAQDSPAENVTVELEFSPSNAYTESGELTGSSYVSTEPSSSYISTIQPLGIVSYGELPLRLEFQNSAGYSLTQNVSRNSTEFLVPFTSDGPESIERRQDLVQTGSLMQRLNPAFSFPIGAERVIRVSYEFGYEVVEVIGPESGIEEVLVRNRIHSGNHTELRLRTG